MTDECKLDPDDRMKRTLPIYDRLFLYVGGGLDADVQSFEVEYIDVKRDEGCPSVQFMKINVVSWISPKSDVIDRVIAAWLRDRWMKIGLQFGASGKVVKNEGSIENLRILSDGQNPAKLTYSVLCRAAAFQ